MSKPVIKTQVHKVRKGKNREVIEGIFSFLANVLKGNQSHPSDVGMIGIAFVEFTRSYSQQVEGSNRTEYDGYGANVDGCSIDDPRYRPNKE